jgi:hypothetical protein
MRGNPSAKSDKPISDDIEALAATVPEKELLKRPFVGRAEIGKAPSEILRRDQGCEGASIREGAPNRPHYGKQRDRPCSIPVRAAEVVT